MNLISPEFCSHRPQCNCRGAAEAVLADAVWVWEQWAFVGERGGRGRGCGHSAVTGPVASAPRDLTPIIAALEYNQWFTKLSAKDLRLVSAGDGAWRSARPRGPRPGLM